MSYLFFDLPVFGRVENASSKSLEVVLRECGGNTGNLIFRHAIGTQIADPLIPSHWRDGPTIAEREAVRGVVLGAANWLHTSVSFGNEKRADVLRRLGLPVLCIGLGVQHTHRTSVKLSFPQPTIDFLDSLRELDATVLVRDEMTCDQCRHYGIDKVFPLGCPSNFINADQDFGERLTLRCRQQPFRSVVLNRGYFEEASLSHDNRILESIRRRGDAKIVVQTNESGLMALALGRGEQISRKDWLRIMRAYRLPLLLGRKAALEAFKRRIIAFLDVSAWLQEASHWDLALGSRIHGAMAALQAGTPAVLTTIDSRTEGLASQMQVPHLSLDTFNAINGPITPELLWETAGGQIDRYLERRKVLVMEYIQHLRDFGLAASESLKAIAANA